MKTTKEYLSHFMISVGVFSLGSYWAQISQDDSISIVSSTYAEHAMNSSPDSRVVACEGSSAASGDNTATNNNLITNETNWQKNMEDCSLI